MTHIAPGTRVVGQFSGPTELLIEGEVEGEIRVDAAVMIGADGAVKGPVSANVVRVGGRVEGNVQATERVEVAPSGTLEGDITAPRVIIAEGAFFKGRVEMRPQEKKAAERQAERVPEKVEEKVQPEKAQMEKPQEKVPENRRGTKAPAAT